MNKLSFWGKGEKIEALHVVELRRAKALADLVSDRYFVEKEVSLNPESFGGILKVIRDSSNRTCLYISYRGEDIFLWTAKQSKQIAFWKTKLSESYVSKHGEMSVDDLFKKESLLRNFHVLPNLSTGSLFGERVKKSQGEGMERVRACRKTSEAVVPRNRWASDPDASYWREHWLLTGLIYIAFLVGT